MSPAILESARRRAGAETGDFSMNFREKTAWLNVIAMVAAYTVYFGLLLSGHPAGREVFPMLWLFGSIAIAHAVTVIIGTVILSAQAPKSERARADERDRAIRRRGATMAYYVLLVGMMVVGVYMPFVERGVPLANMGLLAIVIAELVNSVIVLVSYRRGWHG
jgi:heme A synthase